VIPVVWIMMVEFLTLDGISTQGVLVLFLQHFVAWVQYNSQRLSIRALLMPPIIETHIYIYVQYCPKVTTPPIFRN
jgi:hypothetical protein